MSPTTVRHVLTRKRAVLRDSITVVRYSIAALWSSRFLLRMVGSTVALTVLSLMAWRQLGPGGIGDARSVAHSVVVGIRFLVVMALQFLVATWLYASFSGTAHTHIRRLLGRLARRLPGFALCAAFLAWSDRAASLSSGGSIVRLAVAFGFSYVLSYAIPAAAVYDTGLLHAFRGTYRALRSTFGADLLAWSGVWIVNGITSILGAIPDALDLYRPDADGTRFSVAGRLVNWLVLMPAGITAQAICAAFVTVIFFALERNKAPEGFPKAAVETVSGLQLDD
ncbi:MAG: hypothetical protein Q7V57_10060 [Actinomycetota bacterium]|nr:hypothetical protein [Actinomycetota bacterium]